MNAKYNIIGLMSGTSLDGLDIVKCTYIKKKNGLLILNIGKQSHTQIIGERD